MAATIMGPDVARDLLGPPSSWNGWLHKDERRAESTLSLAWDTTLDRFRKGGAPPANVFEAGTRFTLEGIDPHIVDRPEAVAFRAKYKLQPNRTKITTPDRGPWASNSSGWFAAGYGPMRRLTGSSTESVRFSMGTGSVSRFVTLFREDAALTESETWLKTNHSRWLESANPDLKTLLDEVKCLLSDGLLPHGMKTSKVTVDDVYVEDADGIELPMHDISDGCRGIYATVLDLVHNLYSVYGLAGLFARTRAGKPFLDRPGVVLIDEIEAHLHPSWQRIIPEWFKAHFPKIQFFVTTHSPLVAQSADDNGIFLLPSSGDHGQSPRPLKADEIERLRLGRAETVLLGVAFGMRSVRSPYANTQIDRWKLLKSKSKAGVLLRPEAKEFRVLEKQMRIAFDLPTNPA